MSEDDVEDLKHNMLVKFSASNPYHFEFHHQSKIRVKGTYYYNIILTFFFSNKSNLYFEYDFSVAR